MKTQWVDANPGQGILGTLVTAAWLRLMGNHRHTGIDEDGNCPLDFYTAGGTANALTITCKPPLTAHIPGMPIYIRITTTNTGSPVTVNIDGLGAKSLKKGASVDLAPSDLQSGDIIVVEYEASADCYVLLGGRALLPASMTLAGILKLASDAQAQGLADNSVAITPYTLGRVFAGQSLQNNGYQRLPGGLIFQWGMLTPSNLPAGGSVAISFPIAFPDAVFATLVTDASSVALGGVSPASSYSATTLSLAQFALQNHTTVTKNEYVQWLAVGK